MPLSPRAQSFKPAPGMSRIGVAPRTAVTHAQMPRRPQHRSLSRTASRLPRSDCLIRSGHLQLRLCSISLIIALNCLPTLIRPHPAWPKPKPAAPSTCWPMPAPCCLRCPQAPGSYSTKSSSCPCRAFASAIKIAHAADSARYACQHYNEGRVQELGTHKKRGRGWVLAV